jgi:Sulfotransferase domain
MNAAPLRIAMWSGPRNISTAMMRSFEARGDTAVSDEPFYAAYLRRTGIDHPLRDAVIASQPTDWREAAATVTGPIPQGRPIWYQKHMTLHMLPEFGRAWMRKVTNAFLIRDPEAVLASYAERRDAVTLEDIGFVQQRELFDAQADQRGRAPPVVDAADILTAPGSILEKLCAALGISYTSAMLRWPAGRRSTDGVWAPAWYQAVEKSTGFSPLKPASELPARLRSLADQARPHYDALARYRLR